MSTRSNWILLFVVVLAAGSFFRLYRLNDRPMHTDEAVHAEKFAALLENGKYVYDPEEFHGPTLNYFTLLSANLRGEKSYSQIDEATLRLVPAAFGIGLMLTPLFFLRGLSRRAVFFCCLTLAFSPAFVYYSRDYIQETLLVFFTAAFVGCGWRYFQTQKPAWLIASGVSLGLMHASKETFIFSLIAAVAGLGICGFRGGDSRRIKISHLFAALFAGIIVSVLFYSSFGANWQGVADSIATYATWFKRAGGETAHVHPWYYYLDLLTWIEFVEPPSWNEDGIVVLAAFGAIFAFTARTGSANSLTFIRFFAVYTLILMVIYSLIPYKTPWCVLSFLYGMAVLAGFAMDRLIQITESRGEKVCVGILLAVFTVAVPIIQSWMLNFRYASAPANPYVYAHTTTDIYPIIKAVDNAAEASGMGRQMPVYVIAAENDYWPLPWYLRGYENIGYWAKVDSSAYKAPVILAEAAYERELLEILYTVPEPGNRNLYVPLFDRKMQLRPGVEWRGYIRKELWDRIQTQQQPMPIIPEQKETSWMKNPDKNQIENCLKFSHQAMNTAFEVYIQDSRGSYAGRAARAAFNEIDRLEKLLSRFIPNSDISRINHSPVGADVAVAEDTMNCLLIAQRAYGLTEGAFDVTIGGRTAARNNSDISKVRPSHDKSFQNMLQLDRDVNVVKRQDESVNLDLGGIGKGYAVDRIAKVLNEWGIRKALVHGGASSVLAMDPPEGKTGWPVTFSNPATGSVLIRINSANEVFSCSGFQKEGHIIDPETGIPATGRAACWVRLPGSAALADALSTAGMIMPLSGLRNVSDRVPDISLMCLMNSADSERGELVKIGPWPED